MQYMSESTLDFLNFTCNPNPAGPEVDGSFHELLWWVEGQSILFVILSPVVTPLIL